MATYKQSTAYTRTFLMVLTSDHLTGATGKTVTVNISKAGAAFGAAGGTVSEIANGWYKIVLNTTDTNTLGDLSFHCTASACDDTDFGDQVTTLILGDLATPTNITAGTLTTVTTATNVTTVNGLAANVITAAATAADFTTEIQTGLATAAALATAQTDLDTITGSNGVIIATGTQTFNMTGNVTGNLSGSVGSVAGAVGSVTGNVGGNVTGTVGSVVGAVGSVTGAVGSVTGAVGSVTGAVGSVTGNVGGNVTGSIGSLGATAQANVRTQAGNALEDYGAIP